MGSGGDGSRPLRSDAAANRDRLLAAAARAVVRDGPQVPLARVAAEAGVGVATLYRRFDDRPALLDALQARSYRLLAEVLDGVLAGDGSGHAAVAGFLEGAFARRAELVLPLHGAVRSRSPEVTEAGEAVRVRIADVVARGRADGTLRPDLAPRAVVEFGAMLIEGLPNAPRWERSAAEQREIFLRGIRPDSVP